jgi:hypothetical protein
MFVERFQVGVLEQRGPVAKRLEQGNHPERTLLNCSKNFALYIVLA